MHGFENAAVLHGDCEMELLALALDFPAQAARVDVFRDKYFKGDQGIAAVLTRNDFERFDADPVGCENMGQACHEAWPVRAVGRYHVRLSDRGVLIGLGRRGLAYKEGDIVKLIFEAALEPFAEFFDVKVVR